MLLGLQMFNAWTVPLIISKLLHVFLMFLSLFLVLYSAMRVLLSKLPRPWIVDEKKDDGYTALHLAALNNHVEVAELLVRSGRAQLDLQNVNLQTALHLAVERQHTQIVRVRKCTPQFLTFLLFLFNVCVFFCFPAARSRELQPQSGRQGWRYSPSRSSASPHFKSAAAAAGSARRQWEDVYGHVGTQLLGTCAFARSLRILIKVDLLFNVYCFFTRWFMECSCWWVWEHKAPTRSRRLRSPASWPPMALIWRSRTKRVSLHWTSAQIPICAEHLPNVTEKSPRTFVFIILAISTGLDQSTLFVCFVRRGECGAHGDSLSQDMGAAALVEMGADITEVVEECMVCSDMKRDTLFGPCGHVNCCFVCAPRVKKCLVCKEPITTRTKVRKTNFYCLKLPWNLKFCNFNHRLRSALCVRTRKRQSSSVRAVTCVPAKAVLLSWRNVFSAGRKSTASCLTSSVVGSLTRRLFRPAAAARAMQKWLAIDRLRPVLRVPQDLLDKMDRLWTTAVATTATRTFRNCSSSSRILRNRLVQCHQSASQYLNCYH